MDLINTISTMAVIAAGVYATVETACVGYVSYSYLKDIMAPKLNGRHGGDYFARKFEDDVDVPLTPIASAVKNSILSGLEAELISKNNSSL